MAWERNCNVVIMLTNEVEGGVRKCDRYWPDERDPVMQFDLVVVTYCGTEILPDFTIRKFKLEHEWVCAHALTWNGDSSSAIGTGFFLFAPFTLFD